MYLEHVRGKYIVYGIAGNFRIVQIFAKLKRHAVRAKTKNLRLFPEHVGVAARIQYTVVCVGTCVC